MVCQKAAPIWLPFKLLAIVSTSDEEVSLRIDRSEGEPIAQKAD
jgi:hypothetical protein